jgi:hypothetical protein
MVAPLPSCLPLRVPPFKASKSRPTAKAAEQQLAKLAAPLQPLGQLLQLLNKPHGTFSLCSSPRLAATWNGKAGAAGQQHITFTTRQFLQGQQEHAPFGQQLTQGHHAHIFKARKAWAWTAPAAPKRDSTCWTTLFHATWAARFSPSW